MELTDERLGAYADGELDGPTRADVERALASNPEARRRLAAIRDITALVRAATHARGTDSAAKPAQNVVSMATNSSRLEDARWTTPLPRAWLNWRLAAAFVCGALAIVLGMQLVGERVEPVPGWQQSALVFHTTYLRARSGDRARVLVDIPDSELRNAAGTYASILDYEPLLPDLSANNYAPTGVRLLSSPYGPTMFVIYQAPESSPVGFSMIRATTSSVGRPTDHFLGGVRLVSWSDGRFEYGLSSDLSPDALSLLAETARRSITANAAAPVL